MAPKLNTAPPAGSRDFLPAELRRREHVLGVVKATYDRYGFEPLETPTMERLETLLGKYGEEGDRLIFRVLHRGAELDRAVAKVTAARTAATDEASGRAAFQAAQTQLADTALRYDLTVPLARVVAEHQAELPRFFKRYQVQPVWRADRPAKGRFREFFQCDVDAVGSESLLCDVEVASAITDVLETLGFTDFQVRLNHRALLRGLIEAAGIAPEQEVTAITALDKLDKVGRDGVLKELAERGIAAELAEKLMTSVTLSGSNSERLAALTAAVAGSEHGRRGASELAQVLAYADHAPCGRRFLIDPTLARGLGYYTGPIFEVQVADLAGSLGGGGRYDDLIGMFLGRKVPAVGFSLGLERILVVMEERKMFPPLSAGPAVMVLRMEEATTPETLSALHALRRAGVTAELYPQVDKLGKQLPYAEQRGAKVALFIGTQEQAEGSVVLKALATQSQEKVPAAQVVEAVKRLLAGG